MKEIFVTLRFLLAKVPNGLAGTDLKQWVSDTIDDMDLGDLEDKAVQVDMEEK